MGEKERQYLSKDDFLAAITGRTVDYALPGSGGMVQIRALSVDEAAEIQAKYPGNEPGDGIKIGVECIVMGMVNPRLDKADVVQLRHGSVAVFNELSRRIMALSGLGDEDDKDLEKKAGSGS